MSEWDEGVLLGDLLETTKDGDWGRAAPTPDHLAYRVIRGTDFGRVRHGDVSSVPLRYLSERTVGRRTLRANDILLETAGGTSQRSTGRTMLVTDRTLSRLDSPATCASFARFLRVDTAQADPAYVFWHLQDLYARNFMQQHEVRHTGVGRFQYTQFAKTHRVPMPPVDEQRRIASALGAFDDLIETNRQLARGLEHNLAATFAISGFDDLSDDSVPLGTLIEVNPKVSKPTGKAPYVDMAALPTDCSRIASVARRPVSGGARFQNNDTILARLTPCLENGKAAFVDVLAGDEVAVGSTEFLVLRERGHVGSHWPYMLARSGRFRDHAIQNMNGSSGRQRCPAEAVERYLVARPDPEELARFKTLAEASFEAITELHNEINCLTAARDELLPLLMSGRVRVKED